MPETISERSRPKSQSTGRDASDRFTGLIMLTAAVSAISSLLYGYDTGIISGALLQIRKDFHTDSGVEQVIAGSILFGAALGALVCSRLSERWGRRRTILLVAGIFVVGTLSCCGGADRAAAVGGPHRARLRGRRRDPDRADVRRRAGPAQAPRPAGADLPGRHRRRDRHVDDPRGDRVALVARAGRSGRRAGAAAVPGHAPAAGEPALAGQDRRPRHRPRSAQPGARRRRRHRRRDGRHHRTRGRGAHRPRTPTAAGAGCVRSGSGRR